MSMSEDLATKDSHISFVLHIKYDDSTHQI